MEDILASIRRILNEEEAPAEAAAPVEAPADDDVLVLDESMMVSAGEHRGMRSRPSRNPNLLVPKIDTAGGTCRTACDRTRTAL